MAKLLGIRPEKMELTPALAKPFSGAELSGAYDHAFNQKVPNTPSGVNIRKASLFEASAICDGHQSTGYSLRYEDDRFNSNHDPRTAKARFDESMSQISRPGTRDAQLRGGLNQPSRSP